LEDGRWYQKSLDDGPAAELAGDMQWAETGRVLDIDACWIGRHQSVEARQLVGKLHRSMVRRRTVTSIRCVQVIHLAAWFTCSINQQVATVTAATGRIIADQSIQFLHRHIDMQT